MDSQGRVYSWGGEVQVPTLAKLKFKATSIEAFANKILALNEETKQLAIIEPNNTVNYLKGVEKVWTTLNRAVLKVEGGILVLTKIVEKPISF